MTSADPRRYSSAAEGLKALEESYNYWTGRITDLTFQTSLALIAANWALISGLHLNPFARNCMILSIGIAVIYLLTGLGGAWWMAKLHRDQFVSAEENREIWQSEWLQAEKADSKWPYTEVIEICGKRFSNSKVILLLISGAVLVTGATATLMNGVR